MKNFSDYLIVSWNEYYKSGFTDNFKDDVPVEGLIQVAMQLAKQDHEREVNALRHQQNIEIEYLRSRLKHFTIASESSQKYLAALQNTDEKKLIVANYVKAKNATVPSLNQTEVSELIDMLKKEGATSENK